MSLNKNKQLRVLAKTLCRDLRKNSTNAEKIFWEIVRNRKFEEKKFNRQFPIFYDLQGKESFYIADFYCHEEKLVVELDGKIHDYQIKNDKLREGIINLLGIRVVRFKNDEVENSIKDVLLKLKSHFTHPKPLS